MAVFNYHWKFTTGILSYCLLQALSERLDAISVSRNGAPPTSSPELFLYFLARFVTGGEFTLSKIANKHPPVLEGHGPTVYQVYDPLFCSAIHQIRLRKHA